MPSMKDMLKANANKQSSGIQKQIQSTNETRSEEEKEVVKKAQKEAGVKKKQNLLTVRMDADMYESFSIYCEVTGTKMSKVIKEEINRIILNNQGLINNNRK